jgi:hypothetical protein
MTEYPFPMHKPDEGSADRSHLRHIALTVIEPDPGCFAWLLMESTGDAVVFDQEVQAGEETYPSYGQALQAGYDALVGLSEPRDGPRAAGEDESSDPVEEGGDIGEQHCR